MAKKTVNRNNTNNKDKKSLFLLVLLIVGIVMGLIAMKLNLSSNSKAAGTNCFSGIYIKGGDKKCYEVQAQCGIKCCNKVVDNSFCKNSKIEPEIKCKGEDYSWGPPICSKNGEPAKTPLQQMSCSSLGGTIVNDCYLIKGKTCARPGTQEQYCCNKKVESKFCN